MSTFSPAFLDEIRTRLPASEVIGRRVKLTRAGKEYKACCPFHKEKSASFTVNDQKGFFHCFGCGAHGDIIGFVMRQENRSFPEAVEVLAGLAGMEVPKSSPADHKRYEEEKNLYTLIDDAATFFEEQLFSAGGRIALDYARGRGLSDECITRFRLGYAPNDGQALVKMLAAKGYTPQQMIDAGVARQAEGETRLYSFFRGRLIFPVGDRRGRVVAFGARLLEGEGPKYINSADHALFHKGQLLYGFSRARAAATDGKPVIVTEGYMDVIRLVEAGFTGAVAPLGTALTEEQIQLIWKIIPKPPVRPDLQNHIPVLCFDGDVAGQRAAARALDRILPFLGADQSARFAIMPEGEDPDTLIRNRGVPAMQAVLDQAFSLLDFMWRVTASTRPLNTPEDRAGFRRALDERVATIRDTQLQHDYRSAIQAKWQAQFAAAPQQLRAPWNKKLFKNGFNRPQNFMPLVKPRPLPGNLQERIVLALLINHPDLIEEIEEDVHSLPSFADPELERLRGAIFNCLAEDGGDLLEQLEKDGYANVLARVLGRDLTQHAGFVLADRPLAQARAGWRELWKNHLRLSLREDLKNANTEFDSTGSAEVMGRISQIKDVLAEMDNEAENEDVVA